jgi:hypothetical protein
MPTVEYLLETGVFYAVGQPQESTLLASKQRVRLTASFIVPFELLAGMPRKGDRDVEREFCRRKAALSKYYHLVGIEGTYWDEPSDIQVKAFGVRCPDQNRRGFIDEIKACLECKSLDELEQVIISSESSPNRMFPLDWLRQKDDTMNQAFIEDVSRSVGIMQRELNKGTESLDVKDIILVLFGQRALAPSPDLKQLIEEYGKLLELLRRHYDGRLDLYIDAYALYWEKKRHDGGQARRNDFLDIRHLIYLRKQDRNQFFVTEDKGVPHDIAKQILPSRVLNVSEFLDQVTKLSNES